MAGIFGKTIHSPSALARLNSPAGRTDKALPDSTAVSGSPAALLSSVPPDSAKKAQAFGKSIHLQPAGDPGNDSDNKVAPGDCPSPVPMTKEFLKRLVGSYHAKPYMYDSIHKIKLNADHSVEFVDSSGHCKTCHKRGQWTVSASSDPEKYTLHIANLKNKDAPDNHQGSQPDGKNLKVDFKIVAERENMIEQTPTRIQPTITCYSKLVFDQDPFDLFYVEGEVRPNVHQLVSGRKRVWDTDTVFYEMTGAVHSSGQSSC